MVRSDDTGMVYEIHREESDNESDSSAAMLLHIYENQMAV